MVLVNLSHAGIQPFLVMFRRKGKNENDDTFLLECFMIPLQLMCNKQDILAPVLLKVHSGICCITLSFRSVPAH